MKANRDFNLAINLLVLCQLSYTVCVCVWVLIDEAYILFEVERMVNRQIEGIIVPNRNNPDKRSLVYYIRLFFMKRISQQTDINCMGT